MPDCCSIPVPLLFVFLPVSLACAFQRFTSESLLHGYVGVRFWHNEDAFRQNLQLRGHALFGRDNGSDGVAEDTEVKRFRVSPLFDHHFSKTLAIAQQTRDTRPIRCHADEPIDLRQDRPRLGDEVRRVSEATGEPLRQFQCLRRRLDLLARQVFRRQAAFQRERRGSIQPGAGRIASNPRCRRARTSAGRSLCEGYGPGKG
jgi:hypothetical protein